MAIVFNLSACSGVSEKQGDATLTPSPEADISAEEASEANSNTKEFSVVETDDLVPSTDLMLEDMSKKIELRQLMEADYVKAVKDFSGQIAASLLHGQKDNAMISPISIQMAMALVGAGANTITQEEILAALCLKDKGMDYIAGQNANLYQLLSMENEVGKLSIANSLWMKEDMNFEDDYLGVASEQFYSSLYNVDFKMADTAKLMSNWIKEHTGGLLAPEIHPDPDQILSIINTIYFKDEWSTRFSEEDTASGDFYLADGSKVTCDYMNRTMDQWNYVKGDGVTATYLYLKNNGRMTFILPDKGTSVDTLLENPEALDKVLYSQEGESAKIILKLPKFSFGSSFQVTDALKAMGITKAFDSDADFSGITKEGMAFISSIKHEAHIGIDEKGVEAAAYTQIDLCGSSLAEDLPVVEMIFDRPFIFAITVENVTLFIGVVNNPSIN
jgi:serpin B